jgi:hypothetical protein
VLGATGADASRRRAARAAGFAAAGSGWEEESGGGDESSDDTGDDAAGCEPEAWDAATLFRRGVAGERRAAMRDEEACGRGAGGVRSPSSRAALLAERRLDGVSVSEASREAAMRRLR